MNKKINFDINIRNFKSVLKRQKKYEKWDF